MAIRAYGNSTTDHSTWASKTAYTYLEYIIPVTPDGKCYECTVPGTSGTDEPSWNSTLDATTVDGDMAGDPPAYTDPVTWTCRQLLSPNPLEVELDTEGFGGYSLKDIWVKSGGTDEFIVYGSHDAANWRQIDELNTPHGDRDNRHKGLQNAYRHIKVVVDSENECEIEIVAGVG